MHGRYKIVVEVWPYSTGDGRDKDQEAAGERVQTFEHICGSFNEAYKAALLIVTGIETGPMVWKAPIRSIGYVGEGSDGA